MTVHGGDLYVAEHVLGTSGARTDQYDVSAASPHRLEFVSQLVEPSGAGRLYQGIDFGSSTGETEMYVGEQLAGLDAFAIGLCGGLECAGFQEHWTGALLPTPPGPFEVVFDVAVDRSASVGDWASGDVFVASSNAIDIFEPGTGGKEKAYVASLTGIPPTVQFGDGPGHVLPVALAVSDVNGELIIGTAKAVYVLRPVLEGGERKYVLVSQLPLPAVATERYGVQALAVDQGNGEIYVAANAGVYQFGPEGAFLGAVTGLPDEAAPGGRPGDAEELPFGETARPVSLAVDPVSHLVYIGLINTDPSGTRPGAIAVFGPDVVVPDPQTQPVSNLRFESESSSWGVRLRGTVNPDGAGPATCWFAWGASSALGNRIPCSGPGESSGQPVPNGTSPVAVHATLGGLQPDTTYFARLQDENINGPNLGEESQDYEFTTPGPGLRDQSVSSVGSSSATLRATIGPHDAPLYEPAEHARDLQEATASPTTYYFQYSRGPTEACAANPSACTSAPLSPASTGSVAADVEVEQHIQGLEPDTTYHYRVVAANEALPASSPGVAFAFYGPDKTFTTLPPGGPLVLPDGRAWEMVTPVDKHGARVTDGLTQAALDGRAFSYLMTNPTESEPRGYGDVVQVMSSRAGAGRWSSEDIALSHSAPVGAIVGEGHEYRFFSEDFTSAVAEPFGPFSVPEGWHLNARGEWARVVEASPVPSERTPYLRHDLTCRTEPGTCYEPFLSSEDVTSGEQYGGDPSHAQGDANFTAATPDERHVIIGSTVALTSASAPTGGLYEWSGDKPASERISLISLLPGEEGGGPAPAAEIGDPRPNVFTARNPVSADGSRVFFDARAEGQDRAHLYVRDVARSETVRVDAREGGSPPTQLAGEFQAASVDGSRAFFTDRARLTGGTDETGFDLYECVLVEVEVAGVKRLKCELRDLTVPATGESAHVLGVLGASEDGSYLYFVAEAALAAGASAGADNLYVAHEVGGVWSTRLVATLSPDDATDWFFELSGMAARVSPDGRWLTFMSDRSLTGFDNRDAKSGRPDQEVYAYDASAGPEGRLVCASCTPTGERPVGGAGIFGWTAYNGFAATALYQPRYLFDNGRLFFDSDSPLVPQDTNGGTDVYEFEPAGVGDCAPASSTFSAATGGCVGLISSGVAAGASRFMDASETGGDVFFSTRERLVSQDVDGALDVYDAHECTPSSPCASAAASPPSGCASAPSASACRAAPLSQPSVYGAPSSETFTGAGNLAAQPSKGATAAQPRSVRLAGALRACRKNRNRSRRRACERRARGRFAAVKRSTARTGRKGG